jgi:hypothetical protein
MRVRVSDGPCWAISSATCAQPECTAEQADEDALDVYVPQAPSDDQARREVDIYLKTWQAMHPGARADLVT